MNAEKAILQAIIASLWTLAGLLTVDGGGRGSLIYHSPLEPSSHCDWMFPFLISFWCFLSYLSEPSSPFCCQRQSWSPEHSRTLYSALWNQNTGNTKMGTAACFFAHWQRSLSFYSAKNDKYSRNKLRSIELLSLLRVSVASILHSTWCKS